MKYHPQVFERFLKQHPDLGEPLTLALELDDPEGNPRVAQVDQTSPKSPETPEGPDPSLLYDPNPIDFAPDPETLAAKVRQVRALVGRLKHLETDRQAQPGKSEVLPALANLLDGDITRELGDEKNPSAAAERELKKVETQLYALLKEEGVLEGYRQMYMSLAQEREKYEQLMAIYRSGEVQNVKLRRREKTMVAKQMMRILQSALGQIDSEIQNIRNQISADGRPSFRSDQEASERLYGWRERAQLQVNSLMQNHEVALQVRMDQLAEDQAVLERVQAEDEKPPLRGGRRKMGDGYIETDSRNKLIYGDEHRSESYILGDLRAGKNVELFGPTGTGKTKLAVHAAKAFSGKDPVVVRGGPGVYDTTFFGEMTDLGQRTLGAAIQCLVEDRVLIIDEDNRIKSSQLMGAMKDLLGKKPGERFRHPFTGEMFTVPPHFRVIVTRNEYNATHHQDREILFPDYRREFGGSYEVGYYSPQEMYDRFFLPKLRNADDGSIDLSPEEIGGKKDESSSPLMALALVGQKIQEAYIDKKLINAVFESKFMIGILEEWKQEARLKKDEAGNAIRFLYYLETKLFEFLKKPIGNKDRKVILEILCKNGFFFGPQWTHERFKTLGDGAMLKESEFRAMKSNDKKFNDPGKSKMTAREVALLDPFKVRKIEIKDHRLKPEIDAFREVYNAFCTENGLLAVTFDDEDLEENGPESGREEITQDLFKAIAASVFLTADEKATLESDIRANASKPLETFLEQMSDVLGRIDKVIKSFRADYQTLCQVLGFEAVAFTAKDLQSKKGEMVEGVKAKIEAMVKAGEIAEGHKALRLKNADRLRAKPISEFMIGLIEQLKKINNYQPK